MTETRKSQLKMLCSFFNLKAGTHCWYNNDTTMSWADRAFDKANDNVGEIKEFLRKRIEGGEKNFRTALQDYVRSNPAPAPVVEVEAVEVEDEPKAAPQVDNLTASMNFMGQVVMELLAKTKLEEIRDTVSASLREDVQTFISETYGPITRKVLFETPERKVELEGVVHYKFDTILKWVSRGKPVFLTGPAGSGKNVICEQVAKVLGLEFYFSNAVTQEYKLTGFTDANGTFHESQFYKAFKNGGVFMLDEMDASIPEVLNILNMALANGYFDFPAPIGKVKAHENFRVMAAGNTFGLGADTEYVGRNQLDAASLNRFAVIRIDYDPRIEESCANGDIELLDFCRKFRTATQKAGIRTVVSYRNISMMADMSDCISGEELIDSCLVKAMEVDDLNAIKSEVGGCGRWSRAFVSLANQRAAGRV